MLLIEPIIGAGTSTSATERPRHDPIDLWVFILLFAAFIGQTSAGFFHYLALGSADADPDADRDRARLLDLGRDPATRARAIALAIASVMTLHFAYGSNMSRALMRARCPSAEALGVATLAGWRFVISPTARLVAPRPGELRARRAVAADAARSRRDQRL